MCEQKVNTYQYLKRKWKKRKDIRDKQPSSNPLVQPPMPSNIVTATIAIILDGEVQEVIRAQDRMAALLLSEPTFVEVSSDLAVAPTIGWKYENEEFVKPDEDNIL